jgi:hypothetical protein
MSDWGRGYVPRIVGQTRIKFGVATYDPSDFALRVDSSYLEKASKKAKGIRFRIDDRISGAERAALDQEIQLVVARSSSDNIGGGSSYGLSRVLA